MAYENVKASLREELGDKYPKNTNSLTDEFIGKMFVPKLGKADVVAIITKRNELRNGDSAKGNWFPEFRAWVGKNYFPEFGAKKSAKVKTDEIGAFLDKLLASLGD